MTPERLARLRETDGQLDDDLSTMSGLSESFIYSGVAASMFRAAGIPCSREHICTLVKAKKLRHLRNGPRSPVFVCEADVEQMIVKTLEERVTTYIRERGSVE